MTQTTNSHGKAPILPEGLSDFMRRRAVETAGLALLIVAIAFVLALLTYAPDDPNFNHATAKSPENILGLPGAYTAEFSLQTLGITAGLFAIVLVSWSWRLVSDRHISRFWLRLTLLPIALILGAIAIANVSPPEMWPLAVGLGGLIGNILGGQIAEFGQTYLPAIPPVLYSIALGLLGLLALLVSMALSLNEWNALTRSGGVLIIRGFRAINTLAHAGEWLDARKQARSEHSDPLNRQEPVLGVALKMMPMLWHKGVSQKRLIPLRKPPNRHAVSKSAWPSPNQANELTPNDSRHSILFRPMNTNSPRSRCSPRRPRANHPA